MPFYPPEWTPKLPFDPPDSISIADFILEEHYGRHPLGYSNAPFTCGLSGKTYSTLDVKERVDYLARGLAKELGFHPNQGSEWDKVIAVFSLNTVSKHPSLTCKYADAGRLTHYHWHGQPIGWAESRRPPMLRIAPLSSSTN